jgi:hypothetical protein
MARLSLLLSAAAALWCLSLPQVVVGQACNSLRQNTDSIAPLFKTLGQTFSSANVPSSMCTPKSGPGDVGSVLFNCPTAWCKSLVSSSNRINASIDNLTIQIRSATSFNLAFCPLYGRWTVSASQSSVNGNLRLPSGWSASIETFSLNTPATYPFPSLYTITADLRAFGLFTQYTFRATIYVNKPSRFQFFITALVWIFFSLFFFY